MHCPTLTLCTLFICAGLAVAQIPTPRQEVLEAQHAGQQTHGRGDAATLSSPSQVALRSKRHITNQAAALVRSSEALEFRYGLLTGRAPS